MPAKNQEAYAGLDVARVEAACIRKGWAKGGLSIKDVKKVLSFHQWPTDGKALIVRERLGTLLTNLKQTPIDSKLSLAVAIKRSLETAGMNTSPSLIPSSLDLSRSNRAEEEKSALVSNLQILATSWDETKLVSDSNPSRHAHIEAKLVALLVEATKMKLEIDPLLTLYNGLRPSFEKAVAELVPRNHRSNNLASHTGAQLARRTDRKWSTQHKLAKTTQLSKKVMRVSSMTHQPNKIGK